MIKIKSPTTVPDTIKKIVMMYSDPGQVHIVECLEREDIFNMAFEYPIDITPIIKKRGSTMEGYFLVGTAVPIKGDNFHKPIVAYYYANKGDWKKDETAVRSELDRRKARWAEEKNQWRNLGQAQKMDPKK